MMDMKKIIYGIVVALFCSGCDNFLEEYSQSQTVAKKVSHFDEVLLGDGYLPAQNRAYISTDHAGFLNIMDDDVTTVGGSGLAVFFWPDCSVNLFGYYAWQLEVGRNPTGDVLRDDSQTWLDFYRRINVMNVILKEIDDISVSSPSEELDRIRVKGECHFIRASLYFTLVNLYGKAYNKATSATDYGVPLKLTEYVEHDKDKKTQFERTPVAKIYEQIVEDLKTAVNYLTESPQKRPLHRASKEAAQLLLSRVYLYMQDWHNAALTAEELLKEDTRLYHMSARDSARIFLSEDNTEVLFSQGSMNFYNGMTGNRVDFAVSDSLVQLYDQENDYRRYFFGKNQSTSANSLQWKYDTIAVPHVSDIYTLRIAEGYLNLAEAYAMEDNFQGANQYLRLLRESRIRNYVHTTYTGEKLVEEIRLERRRELCFEGHRWFDLRRYAVCEKYPYSKQIRHAFNVYDGNKYEWDHTDIYVLEKNDPAYVMQIPKSVLEYDEEQMPENTQRVSVGGFSFENKDEAEQAKKEIEGIRYIKTKTDMSDPEVILQVYNKMIGQKLFETAVGYSYLKDLQEYLTTIPFIKNEDILPIPVTHPRLEESLKKQKREIAQKERVRAVRARQREKNLAKIDRKALETESSGKLKISLCVNAILVVCVVAMFAMALTSDSPTIVDYQSKLLNRYASWEQELTEREKAVSEKEQELGIQVDTEQTDFTDSP